MSLAGKVARVGVGGLGGQGLGGRVGHENSKGRATANEGQSGGNRARVGHGAGVPPVGGVPVGGTQRIGPAINGRQNRGGRACKGRQRPGAPNRRCGVCARVRCLRACQRRRRDWRGGVSAHRASLPPPQEPAPGSPDPGAPKKPGCVGSGEGKSWPAAAPASGSVAGVPAACCACARTGGEGGRVGGGGVREGRGGVRASCNCAEGQAAGWRAAPPRHLSLTHKVRPRGEARAGQRRPAAGNLQACAPRVEGARQGRQRIQRAGGVGGGAVGAAGGGVEGCVEGVVAWCRGCRGGGVRGEERERALLAGHTPAPAPAAVPGGGRCRTPALLTPSGAHPPKQSIGGGRVVR